MPKSTSSKQTAESITSNGISGPLTPHPSASGSPIYSPIAQISSGIITESPLSVASSRIEDTYEPPKKQSKKWTHQRTLTRQPSPTRNVSFSESTTQAISNVNPDPTKYYQLVFQRILSKTIENGVTVTTIRGVHARSQTNSVPSYKIFGLNEIFNYTNNFGEKLTGIYY
jgi:hypothetical protein